MKRALCISLIFDGVVLVACIKQCTILAFNPVTSPYECTCDHLSAFCLFVRFGLSSCPVIPTRLSFLFGFLPGFLQVFAGSGGRGTLPGGAGLSSTFHMTQPNLTRVTERS
jgi:hypothetical protein